MADSISSSGTPQSQMKDATFTKGPWTEGSIGLVGANGDAVQVARLRVGHVSAFENPEAVANGNLMKAAPELYEALGKIDAIASDMGGKTPAQRCALIAETARAALLKAQGN